jgi:hypothetical protein
VRLLHPCLLSIVEHLYGSCSALRPGRQAPDFRNQININA